MPGWSPAIDVGSVLLVEECGQFFAFDGNSLAVAQVPDAVHSYLLAAKMGSPITPPNPSVASVLEALGHAGFFRPAQTQGSIPPSSSGVGPPLQEAYLVLTDKCNLRCRYCFNSTSTTMGARHRSMTPEVLERSIDFLASRACPQSGLRIVLWGGEPLLDRSLLRRALEYGRQAFSRAAKPLLFATTTNGTQLADAETCALLVDATVVVNLSIDGDAHSHDMYRVDGAGRGTHADVVDAYLNYREALGAQRSKIVPRARVTVSHATAAHLFENHLALWRLGIPIVWSKDVDWLAEASDVRLRRGDYAVLDGQYRLIREHIYSEVERGRIDSVAMQLRSDLGFLHRRERRGTCGAGATNVSIMPNGDVIACYHLESLGAEHHLGSVITGTLDDKVRLSLRRRVDDVGTCNTCEYRYLCATGCWAKGVAHGESAFTCWTGQCDFTQTHYKHVIRMYGHLLASDCAPSVRAILSPPEQPLSISSVRHPGHALHTL